jgi:hypothetical protein
MRRCPGIRLLLHAILGITPERFVLGVFDHFHFSILGGTIGFTSAFSVSKARSSKGKSGSDEGVGPPSVVEKHAATPLEVRVIGALSPQTLLDYKLAGSSVRSGYSVSGTDVGEELNSGTGSQPRIVAIPVRLHQGIRHMDDANRNRVVLHGVSNSRANCTFTRIVVKVQDLRKEREGLRATKLLVVRHPLKVNA